MNVVLPEIDGRILARAISFKAPTRRSERLEFTRIAHAPAQDRIGFVADLACAWARLRRKPAAERRLACVLSDYPAKGGRVGYAVGLDTPASVAAIAAALQGAGYDAGGLPEPAELVRRLSSGEAEPVLSVAEYEAAFAALPEDFAASVQARWGDPASDPAVGADAFRFRIVRAGRLIVAVQPDRGHGGDRKSEYHDSGLPPRHGYVAFYLWLRRAERIDALVHCGTHGTLEWLPGKSVALSASCAPEAVLGAIPVVYPFIVNNPGEAAQAKRRIGAVTIGHLTPPLIAAGAHGVAAELEGLFDEYAAGASARSAPRARARRTHPRARARSRARRGLRGDGPRPGSRARPARRLALRPQGHAHRRRAACVRPRARGAVARGKLAILLERSGVDAAAIGARLDACAAAEMHGLIAALDGRFVAPGPAGAPARGRLDVLPTGRNLYAVDPRAVPTRTAWEIGRRAAEAVRRALCAGSRRMAAPHRARSLGQRDDAHRRRRSRAGLRAARRAAGLGSRPRTASAASRSCRSAMLGRPRVDVTLRISGLFRDVFPDADRAVRRRRQRRRGARREPSRTIRCRARRRAGARARCSAPRPGDYGIGARPRRSPRGDWHERDELGAAYLAATSHAYDGEGEGRAARAAFARPGRARRRLRACAGHAGPGRARLRRLRRARGRLRRRRGGARRRPRRSITSTRREPERIARAHARARKSPASLRGRATNPRWIAGQMRHGYRGAAEIAETLDNLFAFAALTDAVPSRHFDLLFDATCGDEAVREFLVARQSARRARHGGEIRRGARGAASGRRAAIRPPRSSADAAGAAA